jgi:hypothetical protein
MNKLTATLLAVALVCAAAVPASAVAAKGVPYKGKTTGGHKITFNLFKGGKRIRDLVTATPTQCLPIQGGGSPQSGMDLWNPANGTIRGQLRQQFSFLIPKYPIGTFIIYSCLGTTKFTAKPA